MAGVTRRSIQFFYDLASPYSWIGLESLSRYKTKWPIDLHLRPMFLSGVMADSGNQPPGMNPRKAAYLTKDVDRLKEMYKIPINRPTNPLEIMFDPGTLKAQRFLTAVDIKYPKHLEEVSRQLWLRAWSRDEPIFEPQHFKEAGECAGMSDTEIEDTLKICGDKEVKDRLKATTAVANEAGAFGAPTILVEGADGKEHMVFGSDRLEVIAHLIGEKYHGPLPELSKL